MAGKAGFDDLQRVIRRCIVKHDKFKVLEGLTKYGLETLFQVESMIVIWNDNADQWIPVSCLHNCFSGDSFKDRAFVNLFPLVEAIVTLPMALARNEFKACWISFRWVNMRHLLPTGGTIPPSPTILLVLMMNQMARLGSTSP